MTKKVKIVQWGLGNMGSGSAKMALGKKGIDVVGAIANSPGKAGKDLGEYLGLGKNGVLISNNALEVIKRTKPDVVLLSTNSMTKEVYPEIEMIIENGVNCISIAEELAYPWATEPELANKIDELAKQRGVTVLGTGINPGFILDILIIALTGPCTEVKRIKAARINDLSPFGTTVMKSQGVGTTPEQFYQGVEDRTIQGHIGFPQSIHLIARALGWEVEKVVETREPIISKIFRETPHVKVEPGMVAGCRHCAKGIIGDEVLIELEHPQQIHPEMEGVATGDYIWIEGVPNVNMEIKPEVPGGIGTIAFTVNMIPHVLQAKPGLVTMADLPVPRALMGDIRSLMEE